MKYFKSSEFDQKDMPGSGKSMDSAFLGYLDELRDRCGFPLVISSGYRTPEYNAKVSNTGTNGPHTTGKAADILISGERAYIVLREAMAMGVFTGIGIKQTGEGRFIHLDICTENDGFPRPMLWSYS
jgi:zinc D-Ala-D-Ala carboxypeptidase